MSSISEAKLRRIKASSGLVDCSLGVENTAVVLVPILVWLCNLVENPNAVTVDVASTSTERFDWTFILFSVKLLGCVNEPAQKVR